MIPPKVKGKVTYIAPAGDYNIEEEILCLEFDGKKEKIAMSHWWPVR
jgi:V-type H+-transporting ATPase subunit A